MRVLFVTHSFPRSVGDGAGAFVLRLAVALKARGVEVRVLAPSAPGLAGRDTIDGIEVHRFRYAPRSWETLAYEGTMAEQVSSGMKGKLALLGLIWGTKRAVVRAVSEFRPDVVHAHWWFPCGLGAANGAGQIPLVVTMHGSDVRLAAKTAFAPMFFRKVMRRAAATTAVSGWLADQAAKLGAPVRPEVASMPTDVERFEFNGGNRSRSVLFVGRLNKQKGPADLIRAMSSLPSDVSVDLVGDGPDRAALEAQARAAGVLDRAKFHGQLPRSAIVSLYRQASVVAMPSTEEGLGLVAAESLLTGTPVVAYNSGGVTDLVVDGETGILCPPGDSAAMAGSLNALLSDPARARRMGATGRERMLGRFTPDHVARTYEGIYTRVAGS
jgi:glycosyltransferase involved in cell wall biosynthesis